MEPPIPKNLWNHLRAFLQLGLPGKVTLLIAPGGRVRGIELAAHINGSHAEGTPPDEVSGAVTAPKIVPPRAL